MKQEEPKRLTVYDTPEGMELLELVAQARGVKKATLVRLLVREEAKRLKIQRGQKDA